MAIRSDRDILTSSSEDPWLEPMGGGRQALHTGVRVPPSAFLFTPPEPVSEALCLLDTVCSDLWKLSHVSAALWDRDIIPRKRRGNFAHRGEGVCLRPKCQMLELGT